MAARGERRSILLGTSGFQIGGGIACVSRCIARVLDESSEAGRLDRVDRVLLLEDPANAPAPPRAGAQWLARGNQARFAWQLWRVFRRYQHDLIVFDYPGLARAVTLPLPSFSSAEIAVFVHGRDQLARALKSTRVSALRRARILLTNSEFTANLLREQLPTCADRVRVTPLCVDPERTTAWEKAYPQPTTSPRAPAALIVGRMWSQEPGKGHDELIAAWPTVRRQVPGAELWVVGPGDDRLRLEQLAQSLGVAEAVRFLGRVSDEELGDLYRRAAVFAMPSCQEGFGLVYAEAMWHGLPCIGSTADAARYVIVDGETGLLVPYGDVAAIGSAVAALLADPARAQWMGEAGRRLAREQFSYARFRRDLLTALELD